MPTITKKELEEYKRMKREELEGKRLSPDGLRIVCAALNYDAEAIGKHFLEVLGGMQSGNGRF